MVEVSQKNKTRPAIWSNNFIIWYVTRNLNCYVKVWSVFSYGLQNSSKYSRHEMHLDVHW